MKGNGKKPTTTTTGKKRRKMESCGPTRRIRTRLQAKKLHGALHASPEKPPPAISPTKRRYEDSSSSSIWVPTSPDDDSDYHGSTSPSTHQSPGYVALNEDMDWGRRAYLDALHEYESQLAHEPVIPCPSSSPVIAPGFLSPDSSFRLASRNVQVEEPRRVERNETATDVFCPTSSAEKATLSPVLIEDDVESAALVPVEKYKVRPSSKATLELIFQKYGDIAANLDLEMLENRSSVLDEICEIIHSFRGNVLKDLPLSKLQSKVDRLRPWKRSGLEIDWLLERLEGALEAKQYMSRALEDEWNANVEAVNRKKRELEEADHKIKALEQQKIKTKQELKAAEAELKKVKEAKAKISPYDGCPILDKLL